MTAVASRQLQALRGRRRDAALRVIGELRVQGCEAAGYRLAGDRVQHVCCRHLYSNDRLLTVWLADDRAVIVLIGPHNRDKGDVYVQMTEALHLEIPPDERAKPPCCDKEGVPPGDEASAEDIIDAVETVARRRRRRR